MRNRTNFAPTAPTIMVALVLMLIGLGTYGTVIPNQAGVLAFVIAIVLLLLGMVIPGI